MRGSRVWRNLGERAPSSPRSTPALMLSPSLSNPSRPAGQPQLRSRAVTTAHPLVTLVAPRLDWFVGVSGLSLLDAQGEWLLQHQVDLFPYDAGTARVAFVACRSSARRCDAQKRT